MGISFASVMAFNKDNKSSYKRLKEIILADNVNILPFVGAGMSAGVCPLWASLLFTIAQEYESACYEKETYSKEVETRVGKGDFEGAATYLIDLMGRNAFVQKIKEQIDKEPTSLRDVTESCRILPDLFSGGAITTNFDCVLEFVYQKKSNPFKSVIIPRNEKDLNFVDRLCRRNRHTLLKLHGTASQPESWIFTTKEYENNYHADYESILRQLFLTGNFLFLGCSLNQDRTIKVLSAVVHEEKNREFYNFAILEAPEITESSDASNTFQKRARVLSDSGITVIWYPHGKHDSVDVILNELLIAKRKKTIISLGIAFAALAAVAVFALLPREQKKQAALAETPTPAATQKATATSKITTPTPRAETFLPAMQDTAVGSVAQGRIAAGSDYTAILLDDGTVLTYGGARSGINTSSWNEIVQISGYDDHIVGLKADGTLVGTGTNNEGDLDIQSWMGVVQVATGYHGTSALTEDGYVLYTGTENANIDDCVNWKDIEILVAGDDHMAGITKDGKMVASGYNSVGQCDVGGFTNIACAAVGCQYTFAVDADGDVSIAGGNEKYAYGQYNAVSWKNIIAIDSGDRHVVGLTKDGKVYAAGENLDGQLNVDKWENVIAICAGQYHTVAISTDGTIHATGRNGDKQSSCNGTKLW